MYTLVVGRPPFETSKVEETYQKIKDVSYTFPTVEQRAKFGLPELSYEFEDLITLILQRDPFMRPSLDQIEAHAFFTSGDNIFVPDEMPAYTLNLPPSQVQIAEMILEQKAKAAEKAQARSMQLKTIGLFTMGTTIMGKTHHLSGESPFEFKAPILVQRWVDYSEKYGIGYKLTNGQVGALFND